MLESSVSAKISLMAAILWTATAGGIAHADGPDEHGAAAVLEHAPIGVMGDHIHAVGEVMLSLRYQHMNMAGNRTGTSKLAPEQIATTIPNIHFGQPMQPPTLRVVPTEMTMDMIMAGAMYAPTDWLTLMAMGMYVRKEMDHITFQGAAGTTRLGGFTTKSDGLGDTKLTGLIRLVDQSPHRAHLNLGISLPTGSITETGDVLTPMNTTPTLRLPYAMQLGSGTFDLLPGLTYANEDGDIAWGTQATGIIRLGRNDGSYSLGDIARLSIWGSYAWAPWISTSLRLAGEHEGRVGGQDPLIVAPVQTANPSFYGGERIELSAGLNLMARSGALAGHRLAIELSAPVYQNLNGPQLERDWSMIVGWQKAF